MTDLTLDAFRGLTGKELASVLKREADMIRSACEGPGESHEPRFVKTLPDPSAEKGLVAGRV